MATAKMTHRLLQISPARPRAPANTAAPAPVTFPAPPVACEGADVAAVLALLVVPVPAAVVRDDVEPALETGSAEVDTGVSTATELL